MTVYEALEPTAQADLLARARTGERAAFTELVERHHAELVRIAFAITGDLDAALDAAQGAWIKAWQRLPTIREADRLRAWLIAIAANEARQNARAHRRRRVREIAPLSDDEPAGPVTVTVTSDDRLDLNAVLDRLGPDDRGLLAMRYLADLTADQIGAATGLTASGVRSRLSRLVARLREELHDD